MGVLVTGGGGQLAADLREALEGRGEEVRAPAREELDITDPAALDRAFASAAPGLVLNCAAFHNVDACERDEVSAWATNVRAVRSLAERCATSGSRLVHFSTNYVFDGRRPEPYGEDDAPSPRSVYALTKLAGEHAALAYAPGALVVRTAGLYGLHGSASKGGNFVERMLARARDQGELRVVADQRLTPTFTADLAAAVLGAVDRGVEGVLHLTSAGACSWHEFTVEIMRRAGVDVPVAPTRTTIAPGSPDRPLNGVLAGRRAEAAGIAPLPDWRDGLGRYMDRAGLATGAPS